MKALPIGLAAAAMVALAACGSSATDSATSSAASAASQASSAAASAMASSPAASTASGDIVAVASANPTTSTLVKAVSAAGLAGTLQGAGPYTVFAPTDDAFAALPAGVLDKLLLPQNKAALTQILTYHVVPGEVMSTDIKPGPVKTVEGQDVVITTDGGVVKDNDATVSKADIDASNGVIHLINKVLLPPGFDPSTLQ